MPKSNWSGVLDGPLAERARVAVGELAEAMAASEVAPRDAGAVALWWAYAGDRYGSDARREAAVDFLCEVIDEVEGIALFGGVVGLAWSLAHVADESADELLGQFDELVVAQLDAVRDWDVISGLAGLALYFLERDHADLQALALRRIGAELRKKPWRDGELIDCGLAHGVPGVVAVLARSGEGALASELAEWTLAQRLPGGRMPIFVAGERPVPAELCDRVGTPARNAWCYGDPGVALALARTAPHEARALAELAAAREPADSIVRDAAFCHGAFGLAHVLQRWWCATGDAAFARSACAWIERGLAMPRPTGTSLLEGMPGAALALVAALGGDDPAWGRMLACDL